MSLRVVSSVFSGINRIPNLHETHTLLRSHVFSFFFKPANIGSIRRPVLFSSYGDRSRDSVSAAADVSTSILDDELLSSVSAVRDADEALEMISDRFGSNRGGIVELEDCRSIISAAVNRGNVDLALSIFYAMRASFDLGGSDNDRWRWSRPDVEVYTMLVNSLAASLRVSDSLRIIRDICRVGISPAEEVPFGKIVRCPSCLIAIAVAQPQHGVQIASCANCRYQYELFSGDITSIESEELGKDIPLWEKGLRLIQIKKNKITSSVHSIVVQTPSGIARTHRFATETAELPAQEGERVTIASAAPSNVYRQVGPFKFIPKAPNFYPGEPMSLTKHKDGRESLLLRPPSKDGDKILQPSFLIPLLAVLATGDAASGIIDPSLPQLLSVAAVTSLAIGATVNSFVLPQLNQLPERTVDVVGIKQQLLSQYDVLQRRIRDLKEAVEKEVWMLARMCQLENKILAVGEPAYRTRRTRVKKVRESLENSIKGKIELIDSYARISSMIEIEVEMDTDVLAAEAVNNTENIAQQIEQIMELENLEEKWKIQAEANDEAERLLSSQP
ncbi:Pentatricopeptide repeat [Arabidopsis suecica]|uniref:Pentatricopeptide repeat n=1 Tax=Arabidopsis suecica TaxID=45249 RepID=A0A8T2BJP7_ARASU|nr:Pentatricopeptide repeat [Arabidopsis suecica]